KKEHMTNLISIIVSVSILILTIIFKNQFDSGVFLQIIGLFIGITGLIFWITGRATLGKYFTISHKPKELITNGIYAKIRHPMYSGGILLYLGLGLFFKSIIGIVLTIILLAPLLIYSAIIEERLLIKKYGKSYIEYKKKTIF
ncbi:MAG: methyltransferase family protein, partial [Candidatus Methanofastidiosia archaeon]